MEKMKKVVSTVTAAVLAAGMLASCGGGTSDGKTKLSVGDWPTKENKNYESLMETKADFEEKNPDVEIIPDTWKFDLQTFYPKAEAGMLPNLFVAPFTEVDKLIDGDYALDVTDKLKEKGWYDNMNESVRELVSKDGRVHMIPYQVYALGITYNTEMFEQAGLLEADGTPKQPKTWEELAEFGVKIKEATGKAGLTIATSGNSGGWLFTNIAWAYGVNFMEQGEDGKWKATFDSEEMANALQYIKDLKWKYDILPANILVDQGEMMKTFAVENAGMAFGGVMASTVVKYGMKPDQFGMFAVPAGPAKRVSLVGGAFRALSNKSDEKQVDAAIKWIEHIGSGCKFDDDIAKNIDKNIQDSLDNNIAVGIKTMQVWNDNAESVAYNNKKIDEMTNMRPNAARLYNESLVNGEVEFQPEEPVCAQDLYALLDNCIQQVLNDENADCAQIAKKANEDFQTNYLNNLDY